MDTEARKTAAEQRGWVFATYPLGMTGPTIGDPQVASQLASQLPQIDSIYEAERPGAPPMTAYSLEALLDRVDAHDNTPGGQTTAPPCPRPQGSAGRLLYGFQGS